MSLSLAPIVVFKGVAFQTINSLAASGSAADFYVKYPCQAVSELSQFWVRVQRLLYCLILKKLQPSRWNLEGRKTKSVGDRHFSQRLNSLGHALKLPEKLITHESRVKSPALKRNLAFSSCPTSYCCWARFLLSLSVSSRRWANWPTSSQPAADRFYPFPLLNCPCCRRAVHDISSPH